MLKVLTFLLLLTSVLAAQNIIGSGVKGDSKVVSGGAFAGPGDAISGAKAFFSCARAYNAAYATATGNLCDLVDSATGAATCTLKAATTGFADLTGTYCTGAVTVVNFCTIAHTACKVKQFYDQSGANACNTGLVPCHNIQATLANMATLTFSALNGLPCATFLAASAINYASTSSLVLAQPFSFGIVSKRTGNFAAENHIMLDTGGAPGVSYANTANGVWIFAGNLTATVTASDNAFHGLQFVVNNTSSAISVSNASTSSLNAGTGTFSNDLGISANDFTGVFCEGGLWPGAWSGGQQTTMFNNQNSSSGYNGGV